MEIRVWLLAFLVPGCWCAAALYPRDSSTRETKLLDGIWNFRISPWQDVDLGFKQQWYSRPLVESGEHEVIPIAVPSSFNDLTQNKTIRDFVGWVWYDREFYVPTTWLQSDRSVILRFGSAHYHTRVFVNGELAVEHVGGHLPFSADITTVLQPLETNRITVAINNTLTPYTVPQGKVVHHPQKNLYPPGFIVQDVNFDFYNYAGIHRSVVLCSVPYEHIDDITVNTDVEGSTGIVDYQVVSSQPYNHRTCSVLLRDKSGQVATEANGCGQQRLVVPSAHLWWPWTMNPADPGYLYSLEVRLVDTANGLVLDEYHQPVGIRSVHLTNSSFLINHQPFYFTGFGMHEDMNVKGKGLDLPMIVKDYNLLRWTGANSFRTSHYPYSEELMDLADRLGFVVIDECPAVALNKFDDTILQLHKQTITEMIGRDKSRPSVVMWSVANEPYAIKEAAKDYFKKIIDHTKQLDSTRPITAALSMNCFDDYVGHQLDLVMMNRYYGWYSDTGHPEVIPLQLYQDINSCHKVFGNKLILMSEFGADTVAGLHTDPPNMFSEEFQVEYLREHHKVFDRLRKSIDSQFFVGELVWNFADFMTMPSLSRVGGNKKGVFTRERQPKAAAHLLRCRYLKLANMDTRDVPFCN